MNIDFYRPENGISFIFIGILIYLTFRTHNLRKIYSQLLQFSKTLEITKQTSLPKNRLLKEVLFIIGLCLIILAIMRPRWGEKHRIKKVKGTDLCIALDLSQSMLAEDMSPNRLEYAKRELILLLDSLEETRVALVGFAGGAFIASPLTNDLDAIADYLTPLNPSFVSLPSTFIQGAITTCAEALGYKDLPEEKDRAAGSILLVSDGDDSNKIESNLLKSLQKYKISVSTFLIGKNQGIFIPQKDSNGIISGFIKDPITGNPAKTKAEKNFVGELATKTNGSVYNAEQLGDFKKNFVEDLKKFETKIKEEGLDIEKEEQFQLPLIIGIIILLIEMLITETGGVLKFYRQKISKNHKTVALILFLMSKPAFSFEFFDNLKNNFGVFLFHQQRYSEAQEYFKKTIENNPSEKQFIFNWISSRLKELEKNQASLSPEDTKESSPILQESFEITKILQGLLLKETDPNLKKQWAYQLAQAYELGKKIPEAIESYYESLKSPPSKTLDPMSRHNLARLLKENSQSKESGGGGGGNQGNSSGQGGSSKGDIPENKPQEYKGKDHTPDQVKQILQNVGSEERNVIKKKSKKEAQKRGNDLGSQNGSSKPW
jgi:Ca-activated chloride channel family protein